MTKNKKVLSIILGVITLLALSLGIVVLRTANFAYADTTATFKAVFDETDSDNKTLTFYYDAVDHSGEKKTVYDELPTDASIFFNWGYDGKRASVKSVIFDESIKDFHGLTSTAYMLSDMKKTESIKGVEYLDVSKVTNMTATFQNFGSDITTFNTVPDVSEWNTANVTILANMFQNYGYSSTELSNVPNVEKWNTAQVIDISNMFYSYGYSSTVLNAVPDVSEWDTANVMILTNMFYQYGCRSTSLEAVPNVENWNTAQVTDMQNMFQSYGYSSTELSNVPNVENWNIAQVSDISNMFYSYGYSSTVLNAVPDVSEWNTANVNNISNMFYQYGCRSTSLEVVPNVENWDTAQVTNMQNMFFSYGWSSKKLNFTLDLTGWNLNNVDQINSVFMGAGNLTSKWEVKIPETSSGKTNTTAEWYVGDGTKYISPAAGRSFTLVECYAITNDTPKTYKEQNNGYIKVKEQSPQGKTVAIEVFANEGWVLFSLIYNDGEDHDITEEKSFTMVDKAVTVTATFKLLSFKAVFDETDSDNKTLTFYYDAVDHSGEGKTVYDNLTIDAKVWNNWGYDGKRASVKSVVFDKSIENFHGLTSTAFMLYGMTSAKDIKGAEYLDVSKVTNMSSMFYNYGFNSTELNAVPNVENWNTEKVTDMYYMFQSYGYNSTKLTAVPNVEKWDTAQVTDMSSMFANYGNSSTSLNNVPNVEKWNTAQVTDMSSMFQNYGNSSTSLNNVPNVEKWDTAKVTNMHNMFQNYGNISTELTAVPNVENWDTAQVTNIMGMFASYGYSSKNLNFTLDLTGWNLSNVNNLMNVFGSAGIKAPTWEVKIPETSSGKTNTSSQWYVGNGSQFIVPASNGSFTLVECYAITNDTPETDKEQNNGYIKVKAQSPQGKTITVEVVANKGCFLESLIYNDGVDHDITDSKSFIMGEKAVTVKATFIKLVETVSEVKATCDTAGRLAYYVSRGKYYEDIDITKEIENFETWVTTSVKNGGGYIEPLGHDYDIEYSWEGNECIATATCKHDNSHIETETVTVEFVTDTDATCTDKAKGHYKATFKKALFGVKETEENTVEDGEPLGHNFVNYVCKHCKIEDVVSAKNDSITAIDTLVNGSTDTAVLLLIDTAKSKINSVEVTTLATLFEIRDYWLTTFEKLLGNGHEHTFKSEWSYDETKHWHDNTCDNCAVVSDFGKHTFDGGVKKGNGTTYTCTCGYSYTVYDPFIETESEVISETIKYTGYSLTLSSDISINFYMELTEEQAKNGEMRFIIGDREEIVKAKLNDNGYYFRCPLTSLEMATKVTAEFSYNEDKLVKEYSVLDYIDEIVKGNYNEKLKALCKAIANYGYYAQINLASMHQGVTIGEGGYKEMSHYDELDVDGAKTGLESFAFIDDCKNDNITGVSRSLSLDDKVAMNFYITVKEGYALTKDKISVSEGKKFTLTEVGTNQYRITVLDIEAVNFGTDYEIVIDNEKITTSVLSYANKIVNGSFSESSINVMTALYEYYRAAIDYKVV